MLYNEMGHIKHLQLVRLSARLAASHLWRAARLQILSLTATATYQQIRLQHVCCPGAIEKI